MANPEPIEEVGKIAPEGKPTVTGEQFLRALAVFGETLGKIAFQTDALALEMQNAKEAMEGFGDVARRFVEAHPELVEPETCPKCHQRDVGQRGEYPCEECGLPTEWGVVDGLTKAQEDLARELQERAVEGPPPAAGA